MKITSVIFLVVGIVISITGYILCSIAEGIAKDAGEYDQLFEYSYDDEGNIVNEFGFSKDAMVEFDEDGNEIKKSAVRKTSLIFEDTDILVLGGAERSRVVFQNMMEGRYTYHISNNALYMTNQPTITDILQSEGLRFDGLRKFLNMSKYNGEPKVILYISDADDLNQYDFELTNCTLQMVNIVGSYDMRLTATDSTISMTNCTTASTMRLDLTNCNTTLETVDYTELLIQGSGGELRYDDTAIAYLFRYDISSEGGSLNLNGIDQELPSYTANLSGEDFHSMSLHMTGTKLTILCSG